MLTLSVATPASSVFVILPGMLQVAGTGAVWAMAVAGAVCVATAFIYAELSSLWPVAGGEYVAVGRVLGPAAGFVVLGVNAVNNLLFPPVAGLGVAAVLAGVWPGLPAVPVAVAVVLVATAVAALDIRLNAAVTGAFLLAEAAALAAVVACGVTPVVNDPLAFLIAPTGGAGAAGIGLATVIAIFALNGYGAAVYFGEEMVEPRARIARTILWAVVLTLGLEGVPLLAGMAGADDLPAFLRSDDPFGTLVAARGGPVLAGWVAAGAALAIVNAVIACTLASARFLFASARDGSWGGPVDRWLAAVHPRLGSPLAATLVTGGVGVACCFLPLRFLLVASGAGLVAVYAAIAVAALVGRRTGATAAAPYRMSFFPLAPLVTLAALGYVTWISWQDAAEGRPGILATAAQGAAALAWWALVLRRRKWEPAT